MQAVFFDAIDTLRVGTTEIPEHDDDEVLLKVRSAGICGTDLHILKGEYGGYFPVIPGHEFSGEVIEVGKNVTRLVPGDRVAVHPGAGIWRMGTPAVSRITQTCGKRNAFKIGDLTYDEGALVEPLACAINGIDTVGVNLGDEVLVVGGRSHRVATHAGCQTRGRSVGCGRGYRSGKTDQGKRIGGGRSL